MLGNTNVSSELRNFERWSSGQSYFELHHNQTYCTPLSVITTDYQFIMTSTEICLYDSRLQNVYLLFRIFLQMKQFLKCITGKNSPVTPWSHGCIFGCIRSCKWLRKTVTTESHHSDWRTTRYIDVLRYASVCLYWPTALKYHLRDRRVTCWRKSIGSLT